MTAWERKGLDSERVPNREPKREGGLLTAA
jgi:hypothetical protein